MPEIQRQPDGTWRLEAELWVPRSIDEVFSFFAQAENLEELTPSFVGFHILTPRPIAMARGTLIDYRITLHGLPMRWKTEITAWEPPHRFVDTQRRGPYRLWIHEHTFEAREGGTLCRDRIDYRAPGGSWVHRRFVEPDLRRIFAYRRDALMRRFGRR